MNVNALDVVGTKKLKVSTHTDIDGQKYLKSCSVKDCNNKNRLVRGLCHRHYMKLWHYGNAEEPIRVLRGKALERFNFWHNKNKKNGCWEWKGHLDKRGYGRFADNTGWIDMAHRWSYKHFVGEIPKGLVIDHLCHNPKCVNPKHLEPITHFENIIKRGISNAAYINSRKTHCKYGHSLSPPNIYISKNKYNGMRVCKICHAKRVKRYLKKRYENIESR